MTGYDYICKSIELFEQSLAESANGLPIRTVAELARVTGYSVYHFTRLFFAVTGQNPKDYISGRILTEAGKKIAESDIPLSLVALQSGFGDYEAFSRSFKKRFSVTPKSVRDLRYIPVGHVQRIVPKLRVNAFNLASQEPEKVNLKEHCLTGIQFFVENGTFSFHKQWATFLNAQKAVAGRVLSETYCQFSSWSDDEAVTGLSLLCALETEKGIVQEPFFTTRLIPAASYIRFQHTGDMSTIHETYEYIYRDWLASQEIKPLAFWEFQRYSDGGRTTGIYIPVALL